MLQLNNLCRVMESGDHLKNGVSPKNHSSRGKFFSYLIIAVLVLVAAYTGCKKDKPDGTVSGDVIKLISEPAAFPEAETFPIKAETTTRSYDETSNTPPAGTKSSKSSEEECFIYNTRWDCVKIRYSASDNPDNFSMFNPLASVLWPGNLVQGTSIESGVPTSVPVTKRQPGNISLALVTQGADNAPMFRTVEKMQFSHVNQAMNDILSGFSGTGYAQYSFEMETVRTTEYLEFLINGNFAGFGASVRAGLSFNRSEEKIRIFVKLHQSYFTMVYDDPAGLDGVFTPDITVNDLRNYTGNGNPICYISSVTYGRVFYLLYESTASEEELKAALNAS